RIDKYHQAVRTYEQAAHEYEKSAHARKRVSDARALSAWARFSEAMQYANLADVEYLLPGRSKLIVVEATEKAIKHLSDAYENIREWVNDEDDELAKWLVLRHSIYGLMYRAKGEDLEEKRLYRDAAKDYQESSDNHAEASALARQRGDQLGSLRMTGRSWW